MAVELRSHRGDRGGGVGGGRGSTGDRSREVRSQGAAGWVRAWTFVLNEIGNHKRDLGRDVI